MCAIIISKGTYFVKSFVNVYRLPMVRDKIIRFVNAYRLPNGGIKNLRCVNKSWQSAVFLCFPMCITLITTNTFRNVRQRNIAGVPPSKVRGVKAGVPPPYIPSAWRKNSGSNSPYRLNQAEREFQVYQTAGRLPVIFMKLIDIL